MQLHKKWKDTGIAETFKLMIFAAARTNDPISAYAWIYVETRINPSVIERWYSGGNPSIKNLELIKEACLKYRPLYRDTWNNIIEGTKEWKRTLRANPETVVLRAIIVDHSVLSRQYRVKLFNPSGVEVYSDWHGDYLFGWISSRTNGLDKSTKYRASVAHKLGHNNFVIEFDEERSIVKRK